MRDSRCFLLFCRSSRAFYPEAEQLFSSSSEEDEIEDDEENPQDDDSGQSDQQSHVYSMMANRNCCVFALTAGRYNPPDPNLVNSADAQKTDICELLEIGFETASAPPIPVEDKEDEDYFWGGRLRESSGVEHHLRRAVPEADRPTFGKKLLIVILVDEITERNSTWVLSKIEASLGPAAKKVWHGTNFAAWAFIDGAKPDAIADRMKGLLHRFDYISDYLMVQPLTLVATTAQAWSPLGEWLKKYERGEQFMASNLDRKTGQSGKTVVVETRRSHRLVNKNG